MSAGRITEDGMGSAEPTKMKFLSIKESEFVFYNP